MRIFVKEIFLLVQNLIVIACKDTITNTEYSSESPDLETSLFSIIRKILKKKERIFDYKEKICGEIVKK